MTDWRGNAVSLGGLIILAGLVWLLYSIRSALLVMVASLFFAYVLEPAVAKLAQLRIRGREIGRKIAAGLVVLGTVGLTIWILVLGIPILVGELRKLAMELPDYYQGVENWLQRMASRSGLGLPSEVWYSIREQMVTFVDRAVKEAPQRAFSVLSSIPDIIGFLVVPVGGYYILADGGSLRRDFVNGLPATWRPGANMVLDDVDRSLQAYVRGLALVVLTAGTVAVIVFTLVGVRYSVALGVLAGMAEAVPFVGALVVTVVLTLVSFSQGLGHLILVLATYLLLNQVNNYYITPRFIGSRLQIHPFVVILAVLAGSSIGGFLGALLALPAAAVLIAVGGHAWGLGRPASWASSEAPPASLPPGGTAGAP